MRVTGGTQKALQVARRRGIEDKVFQSGITKSKAKQIHQNCLPNSFEGFYQKRRIRVQL